MTAGQSEVDAVYSSTDHQASGSWLRVLVLKGLGVGVTLLEPSVMVKEPERSTERVGRALARSSCFAQDPLILWRGSEADAGGHRTAVARRLTIVEPLVRSALGPGCSTRTRGNVTLSCQRLSDFPGAEALS